MTPQEADLFADGWRKGSPPLDRENLSVVLIGEDVDDYVLCEVRPFRGRIRATLIGYVGDEAHHRTVLATRVRLHFPVPMTPSLYRRTADPRP